MIPKYFALGDSVLISLKGSRSSRHNLLSNWSDVHQIVSVYVPVVQDSHPQTQVFRREHADRFSKKTPYLRSEPVDTQNHFTSRCEINSEVDNRVESSVGNYVAYITNRLRPVLDSRQSPKYE